MRRGHAGHCPFCCMFFQILLLKGKNKKKNVDLKLKKKKKMCFLRTEKTTYCRGIKVNGHLFFFFFFLRCNHLVFSQNGSHTFFDHTKNIQNLKLLEKNSFLIQKRCLKCNFSVFLYFLSP